MNGLSSAKSALHVPVPDGTIVDRIDLKTKTNPYNDALVVPQKDIRWPWSEIAGRIEAGMGAA